MYSHVVTYLKEMFTLINEYSTLILVAITAIYTSLTYKLSKESKNERRYQYLQKRLEYLYFPLKYIFSSKFDLFFRINTKDEKVSVQIGNEKGPEILRCHFIDLKLGDVKSYLYMAPPILKNMLDLWADKVSELEDPINIWSEKEANSKISELSKCFNDIFDKVNELIEEDNHELYSIANGPYKSYLERIKDHLKN